MNFDVTNTKEWRPFFDRSFKRESLPWTSVQPSDLHYEETRRADVDMLQKKINDVLHSKFLEWRGTNLTRWNSAFERILREIVQQYVRACDQRPVLRRHFILGRSRF